MLRRREPTPGPGHHDVAEPARPARPSAAFQSRSQRKIHERPFGASPGQYEPYDGRGIGHGYRTSPNATARAGTHTFVFRAERDLGRRDMREAAERPAPNSYDVHDPRDFNFGEKRGAASSSFLSKSARALSSRIDDSAPGVGAYDVPADGQVRRSGSANQSSMFRSTSARTLSPGRDDGVPGVGAYDVPADGQVRRSGSANQSSMFRSTSARTLSPGRDDGVPGVGAYDVPADGQVRRSGSANQSSMFRSTSARALSPGRDDGVPGVGAYFVDDAAPARAARPSAAFRSKEPRFRDGDEAATGPAVGPGSYSLDGYRSIGHASERARTAGASSAFRSRSARSIGSPREAAETPGPAEYHPYDSTDAAGVRGTTAAFRSKEERFRETLEPGTGPSVAPNSYSYDEYHSIHKASERAKAAGASSTFRSRSARSLSTGRDDGVPGVGAYFVDDKAPPAVSRPRDSTLRLVQYDLSSHHSIAQSSKGASSMFKSRSKRGFGAQAGGSDTPGVGTYSHIDALNSSGKGLTSMFRSRSQREFGRSPADGTPSVGQYDISAHNSIGHSGKGLTSMFRSRSQRGFGQSSADGAPSVGQYDISAHNSIGHSGKGLTSMFRSRSQRGFGQSPSDGAPSVGQYDISAHNSIGHSGKGLTSMFRSRSQRGFGRSPSDGAPSVGQYDISAHNSIGHSGKGISSPFKSRTLQRASHAADSTPGVGAYAPQPRDAINGRGSAAFKSRGPRFGNAASQGSGLMYDISWYKAVGGGRGRSTSSPFRSHSRRAPPFDYV
ncbi:hypothetical protein KFE25_006394 [Diacronema lutheri]|uniref:Uncharacterized protein n=1 Tax=Diacronema lutheri TaxID=2081491 RepID=A0A8J5Y281_DIALT|nr:hypothetical protein KFE25_006394 [Diacronema lutheri]